MLDKRGQGLSTNAIILIILGVVVLVVVVLGFTIGWDKILPFIPSDNVETIKSSCGAACATGNTYGFCSQERTLKADDLPNGENNMKGNCSFFSTDADYNKYGIEECPALESECPASPEE